MRDVKIVELVRGDTGAFAVSKRSHFVRRTMRRKNPVSYHTVECLTVKTVHSNDKEMHTCNP